MIDLATYVRPELINAASSFGDMIRVSAGDDSNLKVESSRLDIHGPMIQDPMQLNGVVCCKCINVFLKQGPVISRPPHGLCRALANTDLPMPMAEYRQPFPVLGIEWPREVSGDQHPTLTMLWRPTQEVIVVLTHSRRYEYFYHNYFIGFAEPVPKPLDEILADTRSNLAGPEDASLKTICRMAINLGLLLTSKGYTVSPLDEATRKKRNHKDPRVRHLANRRAQLIEFTQRPIFLRWQDLDRQPRDVSPTGEKRQPQFRRGHWRRVAYGPAYSLHKLEWIEPYWTGGGMKPDQQAPGVLLD